MTTVKLQTSAKHKYGQKNVIPHLGETQIDVDGCIEAPDMETAKRISVSVPDFTIVGDIKKKADLNQFSEKKEDELNKIEENGDGLNKDKSEEKKEVDPAALLKGKTHAQLQTLARESGFEPKEWGSLNKVKLIEYLTTALSKKPE